MLRLLRLMVVASFIFGILVLTGCGYVTPPTQEAIDLQMPRSDMRDVVREAAFWADGQPIFESLDSNYGFEDGRFHIEGEYRAPDGQLRPGFLELAFGADRGNLQVEIVNHNIEGLDDEVERVNAALSSELAGLVEYALDREVIEYRAAEPSAWNSLQISLTIQLDADSMIIPLPSQ